MVVTGPSRWWSKVSKQWRGPRPTLDLAVGGPAHPADFVGGVTSAPRLAALLAVQLVTGYAAGILESVLSAYIAALPDATTLLNRLHAFFGVGALVGPVLAAWIVGRTPWTAVYLVLAVACVPLVVGFALAYPRQLGAAGAAALAPA